MTIDWTRKRELPRLAVLILRGSGILAIAAALALDLYFLHYNWHHFALVERDGWIADYGRVKNLIETRYPNLDWAISEGRADLYRLDLRTTARLERAGTAAEAERALRDFVRAFHDGHLAVRAPEPPTAADRRREGSVVSASTPPEAACEFLRYEEAGEPELGLEFSGVAPFRALPEENAFRAGLLRLDGRKVGLLRIPTFDAWHYLPTCVSEWNRFRETLRTTCESECAEDFYEAMIARLLDDLAGRIRDLREGGSEVLVVDVRGNPGGYDRLRAPVATLLAGRELPVPAEEVAASEETVENLEADRRKLETALALCRLALRPATGSKPITGGSMQPSPRRPSRATEARSGPTGAPGPPVRGSSRSRASTARPRPSSNP